ncbi:hypothetical protein [Xenorhabdus stockiae]|nr:hypothetical protein [Xenorhabdus stockiae]
MGQFMAAFRNLLLNVEDIKDGIEQSLPPPNAPATVARKAKKGITSPDKTLVDTGSMQRAIDYEVIKGGE